MTADAEVESAVLHDSAHQGTNVRNKSVVSGHELVELPAGRNVLIFETLCLSLTRFAECRTNDLIVDLRQHVSNPRKKPRDHCESLFDRFCDRRLEFDRSGLTR